MRPDTREVTGRWRAEVERKKTTGTIRILLYILMILYHTNIHTYRKRYAAFVFANDSTRLDCPWIHRWMFRHVDEVFGKSMEEEGGGSFFLF